MAVCELSRFYSSRFQRSFQVIPYLLQQIWVVFHISWYLLWNLVRNSLHWLHISILVSHFYRAIWWTTFSKSSYIISQTPAPLHQTTFLYVAWSSYTCIRNKIRMSFSCPNFTIHNSSRLRCIGMSMHSKSLQFAVGKKRLIKRPTDELVIT